MHPERLQCDLVVVAERETPPSDLMGESLLEMVHHEPVPGPPSNGLPRLEVHRLARDSGSSRTVLFTWYSRGRTRANIRYAEDLDGFFETRAYLFLYCHRSRQGSRRLSVHSTGNCTEPPDGDYGAARRMALASPQLMYDGLLHLRDVVRQRQLDCAYCYEITHHNPTDLSAPVLFLEVGDGPEQWRDRELAGAAAEAALRLCFEPPRDPRCRCLGISHGDHYAGNFGRLALEEGYAFGHILPGRSLPDMGLQDFQRAVERTEGSMDRIVFKRLKGLPLPERRRLEEYCQSRGILLEKYRRPPAGDPGA